MAGSETEFDIHDLIRSHPYIIAEEFKNLNLKHERVYEDRKRADFVFGDSTASIVLEVKKGKIDTDMLGQARAYLESEKKENPVRILKGVLLGRTKPDSQQFENELRKSPYLFEIKVLDVDVPSKIKICDKCRRANWLTARTCKYCSSRRFITDPFIFSTSSRRN